MIEEQQLGWLPPPNQPDKKEIQQFGLGADPKGLIPTTEVAPLNLAALGMSRNPYLALRQTERGLVAPEDLRTTFSASVLHRIGLDDVSLEDEKAPPDAGVSTAVDWRARWGQNWITNRALHLDSTVRG